MIKQLINKLRFGPKLWAANWLARERRLLDMNYKLIERNFRLHAEWTAAHDANELLLQERTKLKHRIGCLEQRIIYLCGFQN